ncbi:O-antigen ligase family protein [Flavobacterium sp.]|uniref:O-antigen ligase family protein n=1 Tax=Flavobacterium sp. TaxID=239 RepID=UPI00286C6EA4|nr:O-antigen ligase family protein [Flavobacterium sp.]
MKSKKIAYTSIVLLHILFGILLYVFDSFTLIYGLLINFFGIYVVFVTQNKQNQVLYIAAYIVGSEVVLRMTGGFILYEIGKYSVIIYMLLGLFFSGFSKKSLPYWIFLLVLIPGVIYALMTFNLYTDIRKAIAFNISGPICLAISSLYCYKRQLTLKELDNVILCALFPIITTVTYMFLYAPSIKAVITSTQSNFETSGGYGPNQVSTIVGLGIFLVFTRVLFYSKQTWILILNILLFIIITFRGIVTFSRGGIICSFFMITGLLFILFMVMKQSGKIKLFLILGFSMLLLLFIGIYSSSQTSGLIEKRYANQDAKGRVKESMLSGRETIIESEIKMFTDNPILGVGVGLGTEIRSGTGDVSKTASHNEITRMLAEHGIFGIIGLIILVVTPLITFGYNRKNVYLIPFFIFWLLTINHAAMRLAAPAFIYALSLLHIYAIEKPKIETDNLDI